VKKYPIPEVIHGSGGLAIHNKKIMVVGGLPDNGKYNENFVYEYNLKFELIKIHKLKSGYTQLGIQTATFFNDCWYFGCYGSSSKSLSPVVLKAQLINGSLKLKNIYQNDFSLGIVGLYNNRWLVSGRLFDFSAHVVQWEN
jgi:hypothetical protein